ncbi:hypothetical protein ACFL1F_00045 [Chlamydiota bacterium]
MKRIFILLCFIFPVIGCDFSQSEPAKEEIEEVKLFYKKGNPFCNGAYKVFKKLGGKRREKIGTWKYYYPNKQINKIYKYVEDGKCNFYEIYNYDGKLSKSYENRGSRERYRAFYENGKIKEDVLEEFIGFDGNSRYDYMKETITKYYKDGKVLSKRESVDADEANGTLKLWDKEGSLVLTVGFNGNKLFPVNEE